VKIDLSKIDPDQFNVKEGVIAGEICYLVTPNDITCKWTKDTLIYRSSIWSKDGYPVSFGWRKFFNWSEHPEITDIPTSLEGCKAFDKIDGSCLLFSTYKKEKIIRTRGTFDARQLPNGKEMDILREKYPKLFEFDWDWFTLVTEWVTPSNQIVLSYPEPELYLTGIIAHDNYSYLEQSEVDIWAKDLGLKRPKQYNFDKLEDLSFFIQNAKGIEGTCLYFNNDQDIRKIKSLEYLAKHRFKSNATLSNTIDLFFSFNCPDKIEFEKLLVQNFDFECFQMVEQFVPIIILTYNKLLAEIHDINNFILPYYLVPKSRKEVALEILAKYKESGLSPFVFQIYDKKVLDLDSKRKMFNILLENNSL